MMEQPVPPAKALVTGISEPTHPVATLAPRTRRGTGFLVILSLLAGFALLGVAVFTLRHRAPERVLLLLPEGGGLDILQREALNVLLQDHLELLGDATVCSSHGMPTGDGLARLGDRTLVVHPRVVRDGLHLGLDLRHIWSRDIAHGAWRGGAVPPGPPAETFTKALQALPLRLKAPDPGQLLPRDPTAFWDLLQAQAWHRIHARLPDAYALAVRVSLSEPGCASAWLTQGDVQYRQLLSAPNSLPSGQQEAEQAFERALARVPAHPRATYLLAELLTDAGKQRDALVGLQASIRSYPRAAANYAGIAYTARTAGLLDLAMKALARRDRLVPSDLTIYSSENTYLYVGDRARFEASLLEREANPRNATVRFYRGYLALARKDREGARDWFQRAVALPEGFGEFTQLSRIYGHIAAGEGERAREALKELELARVGLRVPDGEFTFKMAEAYALLDLREQSLDTLGKAFAQGFGCARWYRESPFLDSIRALPRWRALLQHVEEREALLASRFQPSDFDL